MGTPVSVIMPCYNAEAFIGTTIDSVRDQTFSDWELIVVDDNSSDRSREIVEDRASCDGRIRLLKQDRNTGPGNCRNAAIRAAGGRYVAFLDCDDLWMPDKLQKQLAFMQENRAAFTFSSYKLMEEDGTLRRKIIHAPASVTYRGLLRTCVIGCLTAMYDTDILGKMYMPDLPKGQDYALWLDILKKCGTAYGLEEALAVYRIRGGSVSRNKFLKARFQWKIYRDYEHLSLGRSLYYFFQYGYHGFIKNYLT